MGGGTIPKWVPAEHPEPSLEATTGFEPVMGVLQTPALTTWPRRRKRSGRRDSNSRPPPWQGGALPLSYFRVTDPLDRRPALPVCLVPRRRFELLRGYPHHPLKVACLPIPPPRQVSRRIYRGRSGGIRTPDRRFWRPLLFQLSYTPIVRPEIHYISQPKHGTSRIESASAPARLVRRA